MSHKHFITAAGNVILSNFVGLQGSLSWGSFTCDTAHVVTSLGLHLHREQEGVRLCTVQHGSARFTWSAASPLHQVLSVVHYEHGVQWLDCSLTQPSTTAPLMDPEPSISQPT